MLRWEWEGGVLVCLDCHNKTPDCWSNRNFFSHSSGAWKSKFRVQHGQFLVMVLFLTGRRLPSCCVITWWRESEQALAVASNKSLTLSSWPHLHLITSQGSHLQIPSHCGVRASTYPFGEGFNSVCSKGELWIALGVWSVWADVFKRINDKLGSAEKRNHNSKEP